jgi:hypothetical protein
MTDTSTAPAARRRQLVLLAVLAIVLGGLVVFVLVPALSGGSSSPQRVAPTAAAVRAPKGDNAAARSDVVPVHLERLSAQAAEPVDGGRNPFRMGAAAPPPGAASAAPRAPTAAPAAAGPAGPPPPPAVPPIPFRFIGIVTGQAPTGRIAVLSDGKVVVHGREGAIIDGRYRIVKIGEESIQIEHQDGRGRQTIRLSGQ